MIHEFRTYDVKPRMLGEYEKIVDKSLAGGRTKYSALFGYWYTEFGPLNQVLHVWPYKDLEERRKVREQVANLGYWPPASGPLLAAQASEIFVPAPFNDEGITGDQGPVYELRIYTYATGDIAKVIEAWSKAIGERRKHSPFIGAWYTEFGSLNKWAHMWAYKSLDERKRIRADMVARKIWPAPGGPAPLRQENKLLNPFPFSPLR